MWHKGALVKHVRGLFKAEGVNNSAEPGNSMHNRFYVSTIKYLFISPQPTLKAKYRGVRD